MTLSKIQKIIDKVEGAGTFALDTPLVLYNIASIVNSFDWSSSFVRYDKCRVIFKANGLYYLIPVIKVPNVPVNGTLGVDYDYVNGSYWLYQRPHGKTSYDILCMSGIGSFRLYEKVTGGTF